MIIERVMKPIPYDPVQHQDFPYYGFPKLDGMRFYVKNNLVYSASNKLFPNRYIQHYLPILLPNGVDGELLVGEHSDELHFQKTHSVVTADNARIDDLRINLFDFVDPYKSIVKNPYKSRINYIHNWRKTKQTVVIANEVVALSPECLPAAGVLPADVCHLLKTLWSSTVVLQPTAIRCIEHVNRFLERCLAEHYEGIILRNPNSDYYFGDSPDMLKYKPLEDAEAIIVGFREEMANTNVSFVDELGRVRRSSAKDGKVGKNTLGSFDVQLLTDRSIEFNIGGGIGLTKPLRKEIWDNRDQYLGKIIKFSYLSCGTKDKPRMPKFLGFRDRLDLEPEDVQES